MMIYSKGYDFIIVSIQGGFCFLIASKPNELQSSIITQKKQQLFMGFYLISVIRKYDHYFLQSGLEKISSVSTKTHKKWIFQQNKKNRSTN